MIFFVRHGETDYNTQGRVQGQLDIPLNDNGINQAKQLSENLKEYKIDIIFCSPLLRARKTAEIINENHNVEIVYVDNLKEFYAGSKQGTKVSEWSKDETEEFRLYPERYGAESNKDFYTRSVNAFKENSKFENALIVSHGGVYKHLHRHLNNIQDLAEFVAVPANCSVIKLK